jgi:hypothetical protein
MPPSDAGEDDLFTYLYSNYILVFLITPYKTYGAIHRCATSSVGVELTR